MIAVAHMAFGMTQTLLGRLVEARQHFEEALRINQFSLPSRQPFLFPDAHGRVSSATYLHDCLLLLGYPEQAEPAAKLAESVLSEAEARTPSQFYFQALAQNHILRMYVFRRDVRKVATLSAALLRLAQAQDFPYFIGTGKIYTGWALVQDGDVEAGRELCREGMAQMATIGAKCWMPRHRALLAECHARAGDIERGLRAIAEARADSAGMRERIWDAELSRLEGRLLVLAGAGASQIETCFRAALTTARRQKARLLELRAATSHAEWLAQTGGRIRARKSAGSDLQFVQRRRRLRRCS